MFRGSAHAFATDALARVAANRALARGVRSSDRRNDAAVFLPTLCTLSYLPIRITPCGSTRNLAIRSD
jgi:uncharacterized protein (DUF924 family)